MMVGGRKSTTYITVGIIGIAIIIMAVKLVIGFSFKSKIPALPDFRNVAKPLQEQLTLAHNNAIKKPTSANMGMLGMVFNSCMFYEKAEVCYELASKKDNNKWIWNYYLGYLKQEMGDSKKAIAYYRKVTKRNPEIYLASYYQGECYQKLGLNDSAELVFKSIINHMDKNAVVIAGDRYDYFPLVAYAMHDLSRIYINTGHVDLAEKILKEVIDYQRAFGPAYRLLGNVYSIKGNEELSNRYLVRANDLTVNPTPVDTLIDKISLLSRSDTYLLKKIDEAEKAVFPEYALTLVNHSLSFFPDNNYLVAKAIKLFLVRDMGKKALKYLPGHFTYFSSDFIELKSVADLLYTKGFYSQALEYYTQLVKLKPDDNQVKSCIIICLSREGKNELALRAVGEMLGKNSTNPSVLADGITLLLNIGEKEKADLWLTRLNKLSPSFAKGKQLRGMFDEQNGNWDHALINYNAAFKNDQSDITTIRLLGNLLIRQKLWKEAISVYEKALESHPNDPYLLERLGTLLVTCSDSKLRDIDKGKELCERAFIHTGSHSITLISAGRSLAIAYALQGDKKNASTVVAMTINLATGEKVAPEYLDDLRNLLKQVNSSK
jgi:tetratricopeptide (TPR) repeat protein